MGHVAGTEAGAVLGPLYPQSPVAQWGLKGRGVQFWQATMGKDKPIKIVQVNKIVNYTHVIPQERDFARGAGVVELGDSRGFNTFTARG